MGVEPGVRFISRLVTERGAPVEFREEAGIAGVRVRGCPSELEGETGEILSDMVVVGRGRRAQRSRGWETDEVKVELTAVDDFILFARYSLAFRGPSR